MPASVRELRKLLIPMFEQLSGLPTEHLNDPRRQAPGKGTGYTGPESHTEPKKLARLLLNMTTLERIGGNDERRVCEVPDDANLIQTLVVKQRRFRIDVRCESFNQCDPALAHLDDLSEAMGSDEGKALLLSNDMSLIEGGIALSRDEALGKFDNRVWSVAVQDMQFTVTLNSKQDPTDEWIECVGLVPCFSGADGELLSEKNNLEQIICRPQAVFDHTFDSPFA